MRLTENVKKFVVIFVMDEKQQMLNILRKKTDLQ